MKHKLMPIKKCPVCDRTRTETIGYKGHWWPIKNFRAHIRKIAEREIFLKTLTEDNRKTPHFDYIKNNLVVISNLQFTIKL